MLRLSFLPFPNPGAGNLGRPERFLRKEQLSRLAPELDAPGAPAWEWSWRAPNLQAVAGSKESSTFTFARVWACGEPLGSVEGGSRAPLRSHPDPASHLMSYPVSGLIFFTSKWKWITMKIYVCSASGWFPSAGNRNLCFPFPFFIPAFRERNLAHEGGVSALRRADHRAWRLRAGP